MKTNDYRLLALAAASAVFLAACAATPEADTEATTPTSGPDATASATMAPARPIDQGQTFADMDTNKDGSLTQDEVAGNEMLTQHFTQADTDGNGSLSQAEVDAHRAEMAGKPD